MLALLAAIVLLAAACGSDDEVSDAASGASDAEFDRAEQGEDGDAPATATTAAADLEAVDEAMADEEAPEVAEDDASAAEGEDADVPAAEGDESGPLGAGGANRIPTAADLGRKLIFTAHLNVEVDDVAASSAEATDIIEGLGGFLFGQNTTGGAEPSSELIFKVLPDDFNQALEELGNVGELRNQSVTTDDVTERIVDLESRIEVADLGVARLRAALEGAATLEDYAEIERLLLDRESDLEVMRGQLRTLEDRVDLATITLLLTQDRVLNALEVIVSNYEGHDGGVSCTSQSNSRVEAGSAATLCFDIVNVGDQTLTDITLTDSVLEIDANTELIEVFGSLDELSPGQAATVAYEFSPERSLRLRTRVVGIPTDGVSPEAAGPSVSTQVDFDLRTFEPDRNPGFRDGFSVALDVLKGIWVALAVSIGFLIPLLILLPFLWLAWMGIRALRRRRPPAATPPSIPGAGSGGNPPPPSPPQTGTSPSPEKPADQASESSGAKGEVVEAATSSPGSGKNE